jgi:hypothetical protein
MALQSPFSKLLQQLKNKIKAEVPEIRYINQDLGQLEEPRPPVTYPCVLIDMDEFDFSEVGNEPKQMADGFVIIRLCLQTSSSSSSLAPDVVFEKSLDFYELEYKLYSVLHSWAPVGFGKMLRKKASTEKRDDNKRVRLMPFAINFEDSHAKKVRTIRATPNALINGEINEV